MNKQGHTNMKTEFCVIFNFVRQPLYLKVDKAAQSHE